MTGIKAVLWDMDGTLVDSEPVHRASLVELLGRHGHAVDDAFAGRYLGTPTREIYDDLRARFGIGASFSEFAAELYQDYFRSTHLLKSRHGALDGWALVRDRGLAQSVVSNADRLILDANLKAMNLVGPDFISISLNDVRAGKPDPEPYLRAAYLLGVPVEQCLVIEDSPVGARAGLSAGMQVVAWPEDPATIAAFPNGVLPHVAPGIADWFASAWR